MFSTIQGTTMWFLIKGQPFNDAYAHMYFIWLRLSIAYEWIKVKPLSLWNKETLKYIPVLISLFW